MKKIYCSIGLLAFIGMKAQVFEEVTPSPFKNSYYSSIAVGDYNNDGYKDVFFAGALDTDGNGKVDTTINELYKNNNGVFELAQVIEDYPVHLSSVKFIDFDNGRHGWPRSDGPDARVRAFRAAPRCAPGSRRPPPGP